MRVKLKALVATLSAASDALVAWFFTTIVFGALPGAGHLYFALQNHEVSDLHAFWALPEGWIYAMFISGALFAEAVLDKRASLMRVPTLCISLFGVGIAAFGYATLTGQHRPLSDLANDPLAQPQLYAIIILIALSLLYIIPLKAARGAVEGKG